MRGLAVVEQALEISEAERIASLSKYQILDTQPEERFDAIVRHAATLFRTPIALISFVDAGRQWFKARAGLDACQTPRRHAFCQYTIQSDEVLVVLDARKDERFADNPLVTGAPHIRFYAGAPLITADGKRLGSVCIIDRQPRDGFSAREQDLLTSLASMVMAQMELRRGELSRSAMTGFVEATELAMLAVNQEGAIQFANGAAADLFGYTREELVGGSLDLIVPAAMRGMHADRMANLARRGSSKLAGRTVELTASRKDGGEIPIELSLSIWRDEQGVGVGAIIRDVSARRARDSRLLRLAHHDGLTGLCNRQRFEDLLRGLYEQGGEAAVLLFDLDGFKGVNDSLGHAAGDALLQAIAIRLPLCIPEGATLARLGGDEFAILWPGVADPLQAKAAAQAVLQAFATPFAVNGQHLQLGTSIGLALGPSHGDDAEELIASADFALYRAKAAGGRCVRLFTPEMRRSSAERRSLQDELARALGRGELVLHYQPQVSLRDGGLIGAEALLRWQHRTRGLLLPSVFLPVVTDSSLALPIGTWVLEEACRQMTAWDAAGIRVPRVAVNLFSAQFQTGGLVRQVLDVLARNALTPDRLELEVTEEIALQNDDQALETLQALCAAGVRIAFDDFGTGYASLSTLKRFPLTTLKIDRSFVRDLVSDTRDGAIARAIISMSNELGLETIAEGIETAEQEVALRMLGCRVGQGYYYGKAMAAGTWSTPSTAPGAEHDRTHLAACG